MAATKTFQMRASEEQLETWRSAAEAMGLPLATWLKGLADAAVAPQYETAFCGREDLEPHRWHHWWRLPDGSMGDEGEGGTLVRCPGADEPRVEKTVVGVPQCEATTEGAYGAVARCDMPAGHPGPHSNGEYEVVWDNLDDESASLDVEQCASHDPASGVRCERPAGHEGQHAWGDLHADTMYRWADDDQRCTSTLRDMRCEREAGHDGFHTHSLGDAPGDQYAWSETAGAMREYGKTLTATVSPRIGDITEGTVDRDVEINVEVCPKCGQPRAQHELLDGKCPVVVFDFSKIERHQYPATEEEADRALLGPIIADETMPPGVAELRDGDKVVARIENIVTADDIPQLTRSQELVDDTNPEIEEPLPTHAGAMLDSDELSDEQRLALARSSVDVKQDGDTTAWATAVPQRTAPPVAAPPPPVDEIPVPKPKTLVEYAQEAAYTRPVRVNASGDNVHTLASDCTNAQYHWKLAAGQRCQYCGGTP